MDIFDILGLSDNYRGDALRQRYFPPTSQNEDVKRKNFENYLRGVFNRDPYSGDNGHNVAEERCNLFSVVDPDTKKATAYGVQVVFAPFKKSDISIETKDQHLIINVGTAEARGSSGGTREFHYRGIDCNPFQIVLPFREICYWNADCEIDEDAIKASTDEGVLEIILPVVNKTKSRRVSLS